MHTTTLEWEQSLIQTATSLDLIAEFQSVRYFQYVFFSSNIELRNLFLGADGPSQMALEDLAMFRAVQGTTVFYPSDAVSVERAVELSANAKGMCYIRGARTPTPVVYTGKTEFKIGKAQVLKQAAGDKVTVIGGGVTLDEALKAADILAGKLIAVFRIITAYYCYT